MPAAGKRTAAVDAEQRDKVVANGETALAEQAIDGKGFSGAKAGAGKTAAQVVAAGKAKGFDLVWGIRTHHVKRLVGVQGAALTASVEPVVVPDTVGKIGILLNFGDKDTRSAVKSPGGGAPMA